MRAGDLSTALPPVARTDGVRIIAASADAAKGGVEKATI
jgi:hypothetical protein